MSSVSQGFSFLCVEGMIMAVIRSRHEVYFVVEHFFAQSPFAARQNTALVFSVPRPADIGRDSAHHDMMENAPRSLS